MKMKYLIAASAAALMVSGTAAKAADIVHYQEPEFKAFSWTGLYGGADLGYGFGKSKFKKKDGGKKTNVKPKGVLGGFYAGYNFQFTDAILVGVETDFNFSDVSKKKKKAEPKMGVRQHWEGSTRVRGGYAFGHFLPYIAVGVAYSDIKTSVGGIGKKKQRTGFTGGVGLDYAMTDHIILRGEYRYTDLGKKRMKGIPDAETFKKVKFNQNEIRVGVAYKF